MAREARRCSGSVRRAAPPRRADGAALRRELGWVPPESEWKHLVFGRGSADQLAGVVAEIVATKILLELVDEGALHGCTVRA